MVCYDYGTSPSFDSSLSGYQSMINTQREHITDMEDKKGQLAQNLSDAETDQDAKYETYQYTTNIFNIDNNNALAAKRELEKLQEDMRREIQRARSEGAKNGQSLDEIDRICNEITLRYSDRISLLTYNSSLLSATSTRSRQNNLDAQASYRSSRFNNIFASNEYTSHLLDLSREYHDLGKMQQNYGMMEHLAQNIDLMG